MLAKWRCENVHASHGSNALHVYVHRSATPGCAICVTMKRLQMFSKA